MARNKHPEETVEKILSVSYKLFSEKGYEHTTIQDIVDALGMSKGAVYHHFKSKEDILDRISDSYYDEIQWFRDIRLHPGLTGLEKLRQILVFLLSDRKKLELDTLAMSLTNNPKLVVATLNATMRESAPFIQELIEAGVADGSIAVRQPRELAEVFMILMNIWVGMFASGAEDFYQKLLFIREFTDRMGLPVLDDQLIQLAMDYFSRVITIARANAGGPPV